MRKIALATSHKYSELTNDDRLVLKKLLYWGVDVEPIVWDSRDTAWNQYDAVFIRSCWDYHLRYDEFFKWIDTIVSNGVTVFNSPEIMRWNSDKKYLKEIQEKGIAIAPTVWRNRDEGVDLKQILSEQGWQRAVVKPSISANAHETWITSVDALNENQKQAEEMLTKHGHILVQEFLPQVVDEGEWSLIFFAGVYSHAILKKPRQGDFRVQQENGGSLMGKKPPRHLMPQAQAIIDQVAQNCVYARVDGIDVNEQLILMELELIEPSLHLEQHPKAPERFAEAIMNSVNELHEDEKQPSS